MHAIVLLSQSVWLFSRRETSLCSVPISTKLDLLLFSCLIYLTRLLVVPALQRRITRKLRIDGLERSSHVSSLRYCLNLYFRKNTKTYRQSSWCYNGDQNRHLPHASKKLVKFRLYPIVALRGVSTEVRSAWKYGTHCAALFLICLICTSQIKYKIGSFSSLLARQWILLQCPVRWLPCVCVQYETGISP